MTLPPTQVQHYYRLWLPLLQFANQQLGLFSDLRGTAGPDSIDRDRAIKVRDALWENDRILDRFVEENPVGFQSEALAILKSWKHRRTGEFFVYKVFKKHGIFINQKEKPEVFEVKGLQSSFDEILPFFPILVQTVLLPFQGELIADGLFASYSVYFGKGIQAELKDIYNDAKERGTIITTLVPLEQPPLRDALLAKAEATNKRVLSVLQKHEYKSGLSANTVERDQVVASDFARYLLGQQPLPVSLRDFITEDVLRYMQSLPEAGRKTARISLKRFTNFLRDTGRLDWDEADHILKELKQA